MTVEPLGKERVLIALRDEELRRLSIEFESLDIREEKTRRAIESILMAACWGAGISLKGKSVSVEALPSKDGCLFFVCISRKRRRWRVKKDLRYPCFSFSNVTDFLDGIAALSPHQLCVPENAVFEMGGEYRLVFFSPLISEDVRRVLTEFSASKELKKLDLERLKEHARPIAEDHALERISKSLHQKTV